jgi:hypothetical protein
VVVLFAASKAFVDAPRPRFSTTTGAHPLARP